MIKTVYCSPGKAYEYNIDYHGIPQYLAREDGLVWLVLEDITETEASQVLIDTFHFHHLTVEDCLSEGYQTPKLDGFDNYLFIIMHALLPDHGQIEQLEMGELDIFLGKNFVVCSTREKHMPLIDEVMDRITKDTRLMTNGADFLCHAILDELVDDYMPLLDKMDDEIEWLEDRVLEKPNPKTLERILNLKHSTLSLRRFITPQREIMNRLSRDDFGMIDEKHQIYFRDIYDHLVRLQDLIESVRDVVSGTLDIYLSATSNRLNEVMKALTIVSTIFLPLSFIAGVYGMNFKIFPELNWPLGYLYVWLIFIAMAVGMVAYFKKRGWF
jgi:magnesium transporter